MNLAFCLGFRNWHLSHLTQCLASIRRHTMADISVCDLGSEPSVLQAVYHAVRKVDTTTQMMRIHGGWPRQQQADVVVAGPNATLISERRNEWSRSRALNLAAEVAIEQAKDAGRPLDYLVFTDADMIFPPGWFAALRKLELVAPYAKPMTMYLTPSRDLPEMLEHAPLMNSPSWFDLYHWSDQELYERSAAHPWGVDVGQGAAMVVPRWWFERCGGFDEFYKVWGAEDNDLVQRAIWDGLTIKTFPFWVAHQWHDRTWATPEQWDKYIHPNRAYLAARIAEADAGAPRIVRNQAPQETSHGGAPASSSQA